MVFVKMGNSSLGHSSPAPALADLHHTPQGYTTMTDRLVTAGWQLAVLGLIFISGFAALFLGYQAMLVLLTSEWLAAPAPLAGALVLGGGSYLLCRHRNDLLWV